MKLTFDDSLAQARNRGRNAYGLQVSYLLADMTIMLGTDGLTIAQLARSWIVLPTSERYAEIRRYIGECKAEERRIIALAKSVRVQGIDY